MKNDDLENELKNLKLIHLTESELISYCEQSLDKPTQARADAHLKQCFICARQLALFREASEAPGDQAITAEDIALVRRVMKQRSAGQQTLTSEPVAPLSERLADYLQQLVASWQLRFAQVATRRGSEPGEEVWQWHSDDGGLQVRVIQERNGNLTICLSSGNPEMEGVRLKVSLGSFNQEITMQRGAEADISAQVNVPRRQRPKTLRDISIEKI